MTIVEKVIILLKANKEMALPEIYNELPEHTKDSIRGNINRYLTKTENPEMKRVDKGIYSVVEIISVKQESDGSYLLNYSNTYYSKDKEIAFYHQNFKSDEPVAEGVYQRMDNFEKFEELEEHEKSVRGILLKGDACEILKKLKDESFSLIVTDPPYRTISGGTGAKGSPSGMLSKNDGKIFDHNDIKFSDYMGDLYRVLKDNSEAYFFTNLLNLQKLMEEVQKVGFKIHNLLIWEKNNTTPNRWYMKNCEYILFCWKGKAKTIKNKGSQTVHRINNIVGKKLHETEKPIELLKMYIENSSERDDFILDPFAGSASTLISSLLTGRRCMTIEIDEKYISTIKERITGYLKTGQDFRPCASV